MLLPLMFTARFIVICIESQVIKIHFTSTLSGGKGMKFENNVLIVLPFMAKIVVNVPADVDSTVTVLPRPINESHTIPIKLKRRHGYKHHYQFQNIRPTKMLEAAWFVIVKYSKTREFK